MMSCLGWGWAGLGWGPEKCKRKYTILLSSQKPGQRLLLPLAAGRSPFSPDSGEEADELATNGLRQREMWCPFGLGAWPLALGKKGKALSHLATPHPNANRVIFRCCLALILEIGQTYAFLKASICLAQEKTLHARLLRTQLVSPPDSLT